jgi:uncharacterized membrane protein
MTDMPRPTLYHRSVGWHAPSMRRTLIVTIAGLIVAAILVWFVPWPLALTGGWIAAGLVFLVTVGQIILAAAGRHTRSLATREDETHLSATVLLITASLASLLGVGYAISLAGHAGGGTRLALTAVAVVTLVLSWAVINTVYTLRYAHLEFGAADAGIAITEPTGEDPSYRDFAYVAFTIGMCFQVSDTDLKKRPMRRAALHHALLSYVFGTVILAVTVNSVAAILD